MLWNFVGRFFYLLFSLPFAGKGKAPALLGAAIPGGSKYQPGVTEYLLEKENIKRGDLWQM